LIKTGKGVVMKKLIINVLIEETQNVGTAGVMENSNPK